MSARTQAMRTSSGPTLADVLRGRREAILASALEEVAPADRRAAAQELGGDVDALEAALRMGAPGVFEEHCAWRASVLRARREPVGPVLALLTVARRELSRANAAAAAGVDGLLAAGERALETPSADPPEARALPASAAELLDALLRADRARAEAVLRHAIASGMSPGEVGDAVVRPAMRAVGRMWQGNEISVAQEHLASAILQSTFARVFHERPGETAGKTAVLACVEGNLHALGLHAVAKALEDAGWRVALLGADVPTRDLLSFLRANPAEVVALSVSLSAQVPAARWTVETLRRELGERCPRIAIGGLAVAGEGDLARYVGADLILRGAAEAAASLA